MKISNGISLTRIILLLLHVLVAGMLPTYVNLIIVVIIYMMDYLDGVAARRMGTSEYGEFMDISVDRVVNMGYFAFHAVNQRVTLMFFLLVLIRNTLMDYLAHFGMIKKGVKEKHKTTTGIFYWIYSSKVSKMVNGGVQMLIAAWGFVGVVPLWLQIFFLTLSFTRAIPDVVKGRKMIRW
ncbi:MAG: CDP-alcohol phosphatidyltransferase family protein [Candidatus Altiarchaeota archaeon]|nr:CDP-alcohol phosphatidyltransferase family protein [Candidatus Altiarchaeota archaeon]